MLTTRALILPPGERSHIANERTLGSKSDRWVDEIILHYSSSIIYSYKSGTKGIVTGVSQYGLKPRLKSRHTRTYVERHTTKKRHIEIRRKMGA